MSGRAARAAKVRKREKMAAWRHEVLDAYTAYRNAVLDFRQSMDEVLRKAAEARPASSRRWGGEVVYFDVVTDAVRARGGEAG